MAAFRSAAKKLCGLVVKEEQRRLYPRISHGGSSLRRFSSSESQNPNPLGNNRQQHLPKSVADAEVARQLEEKTAEVEHLHRLLDAERRKHSDELISLFERSPRPQRFTDVLILWSGAAVAGVLLHKLRKAIFDREEIEQGMV
jgi:hypothetical protein